MADVFDNAMWLLQEIESALKRGTEYYRPSDDKILFTAREVIECLLSEGRVIFEPKQQEDEKCYGDVLEQDK